MPPQTNQHEAKGPKGRGGTDLLAAAGEASSTSEYYSPVPDGYRFGQHKYVVILGTVMSGLGKGIFSSSMAKMLKDKGLTVAPIKMEGYLNIDSGTLNPYRHGEVFVLDDGTECDMDLGTYERMLDQNLARRNFTTAGQIYSEILERERQGVYLGRDVQMIPHVTGEVKRKLRELAIRGDGKRPADVIFVEVGGTVGDYENGFYIEALRELAFEEGPGSVCFVALTYVIEPPALGEQKSKAAQLGIKRLMEAGIQPHMIACRARTRAAEGAREDRDVQQRAAASRVLDARPREHLHDPRGDAGRGSGPGDFGHPRASRPGRHPARGPGACELDDLCPGADHRARATVRVGITGKYADLRDAYASIDKALEHCGVHLGCDVEQVWIETTEVSQENSAKRLAGLDGIIVPGGFGSRGVEGKIACVKHCRENRVPYLGICLGFQVAVIEFARHVLGIADASSTEFDPMCGSPVISELPDQKKIEGLGGTMRLGAQDVQITPNTLAAFLAGGAPAMRERFRHRYEVDPSYIERLEAGGLIFSGRHPVQPIMQILELPSTVQAVEGVAPRKPITHPYFIGAQFHPELTSRPLSPQPMFMGLVAAAMRAKYGADQDAWADLSRSQKLRRWLRDPNGLAANKV
jgi:CTP synthase